MFSTFRLTSRASRIRLVGVAMATILTVAVLPASVAARTINTAQLDDGTCGHSLQLGSNKTSSSSATPWFLVYGNGAGTRYQLFIDGVGIGSFDANMYGDVCANTTTRLADGAHVLTG